MAASVTHTFVSAVADGGNSALVQPSNWNATHTLSNVAALDVANTLTGDLTLSSASFIISGNISAAAWTTSGIRIKGTPGTLTDTTSSGTVAAAYTDVLGGNTIAASSATTFSDYYTAYMKDPVQGSNVTLTRKWSLGLEGNLKAAGIMVADGAVATPSMAFSTSPTTGFRYQATGGMVFCAISANIWFTAASQIVMRSNGAFAFSSTTDPAAPPDTGIMRSAAGVMNVCDGGTASTTRDLKLRSLIAADANGSYIQTPGMTVANLPASPVRGMRCYVTDSNATSYTLGIGAIVAAGGSTIVPVFYNGTNWLIG